MPRRSSRSGHGDEGARADHPACSTDGARIRRAWRRSAAMAGVQRNVIASGVIPQISVIMGPCAGGDVIRRR
jgi:hypothetical protein